MTLFIRPSAFAPSSGLLLALGLALAAPAPGWAQAQTQGAAISDPLAEDPAMRRLYGELREVLERAAEARRRSAEGGSQILRRQFGLDSDSRARELLGSAFGLVSELPVVETQEEIARRRQNVEALREEISRLRERRMSAPEDAGVMGSLGLAHDRQSIDAAIAELQNRILENEASVVEAREKFRAAMEGAGVALTPEEAELLLDSVSGGDLTRIAAAYQAARGVSEQLRALLDDSGEDLTQARRYYGMHAATIALLAEAQTQFIETVDGGYLPKLDQIERDLRAARAETMRLLQGDPTPEQKRALEANLESQRLALEAAAVYRRHLSGQRDEIHAEREKTLRELHVADNTLRTVDASFQLRRLMENADLSFEALGSMKSPGLERIFENQELRREFEALTRRLAPGS
ncbi:hypothetical protein [Neomegalonema sp.]|uniref:hypothetical protein n=1 Tax=Neomegalonema sp. TaxID=2039713 RepID=UPI002609507D|nr:hypothetical protein [Neomegalonema sp.]MDD2868599.1 hypothetical protein [Neomegalonema sp.]